MNEGVKERAWQIIADVRDAHPREKGDADTWDIVDALVSAGLLVGEGDPGETPLERLQYAVSDWLDKPHKRDRWETLCALLPEDWSSSGNPLWQGWPEECDPAECRECRGGQGHKMDCSRLGQ